MDRKKKNPGIVENIDGIPVTQIDLSVPLHVPGNIFGIFSIYVTPCSESRRLKVMSSDKGGYQVNIVPFFLSKKYGCFFFFNVKMYGVSTRYKHLNKELLI